MRVQQPTLLRLMVVDTDKDWGGYKITNLGAPTAAKEALRYGDADLIDHEALKNYPDAKHVTLPAHIAAVLDDHNLAKHPLAIIPTMDDGHIPDLEGLSYGGRFAYAQMAGLFKKYVISDVLLHSHDDEEGTEAETYEKLKTITIDTLHPDPSTLRIKFDLATQAGALTIYGRIYKNGAGLGTERAANSSDYTTYTEDLEFDEGDTIEVWAYGTASIHPRVQNLRVYGTEHQQTLQEAISQSNVGVESPWAATNSTP